MNTYPVPILIFSRDENLIYLKDRRTGVILFSFPAHNHTENPEGDPLTPESWGPAPSGYLTVSPPDFISEEFRLTFYQENFGSDIIIPGESLIQEWGEFEAEQMGRVRFALGCVSAPSGFPDRSAWDRELLIHAGRPFETLTKGCIRMNNGNIERFAVEWIKQFRMGVELRTVFVKNH